MNNFDFAMKKLSHSIDRKHVAHFQQIVNVGPATEQDFQVLGFRQPQELIGKDPWQLYCQLCKTTHVMHDPCVLDVLIAAVDYMNGNPPQKWWAYTAERKKKYSDKLQAFSI